MTGQFAVHVYSDNVVQAGHHCYLGLIPRYCYTGNYLELESKEIDGNEDNQTFVKVESLDYSINGVLVFKLGNGFKLCLFPCGDFA